MEICNCPDVYQPVDVSCLTEALQTELTSTPTNIQQLKEVFYFSNNVQSFTIETNMTVSGHSSLSSEFMLVQSYQWYHLWYEDNFLGVIRGLLSDPDSRLELYFSDPLTYLLLMLITLQAREPPSVDFTWPQLNIQLNCASRGEPVPVQIDEESLREIWEDILHWVSNEVNNYLRCM